MNLRSEDESLDMSNEYFYSKERHIASVELLYSLLRYGRQFMTFGLEMKGIGNQEKGGKEAEKKRNAQTRLVKLSCLTLLGIF
jgi:hypothetical protein